MNQWKKHKRIDFQRIETQKFPISVNMVRLWFTTAGRIHYFIPLNYYIVTFVIFYLNMPTAGYANRIYERHF